MTWFYSLPDGRKRVKRCVEAGILDTLRVICEDKARRKKKRKPHEGARLSGPYSGTPSSASESSVSTRSADYRRGWKLRRRLSSLKCTNAGLRSIAAERLQRINELEAEKVAAWNPLRGAEDADGSEGAERSGPFPRVGPDQATVSMAELEKWKKRMEVKEKERKLAVEETERLRGHHNKKEAAMKDKLKTLRTETRSLRMILSAVQQEVDRMKREDGSSPCYKPLLRGPDGDYSHRVCGGILHRRIVHQEAVAGFVVV
ncbi:hypothetical protein FOZ62_000301 [Perkinsus olseni]|uniref:Uncharacterized protein n=2 Tax=Perkinsus olseni TaxID=32597 RepID=A0A7J6RCA7_PEROL|nr:hypothetical protein FOZ62_000301 [Perkinsus olseni]